MRLIAAALAIFTASALAQNSEDYARMSRAAWSAFECSSFADVMGNAQEQERLFLYGYQQGLAFIQAARAGRVLETDLQSISPTGFLMHAQGPTADFALGRVFEGAVDNALKDVINSKTILQKDLQKSIASRKFGEANCEIVGRGL